MGGRAAPPRGARGSRGAPRRGPRARWRPSPGSRSAAVATLAVTGAALALAYVGDLDALVGTSYGGMLATKLALFAGLLGLGALNFAAVRRLPPGRAVLPARLRRFVEVEAGLGVTLLFVAASLGSAPPAVDVVADRATPAEVLARFTPRWPHLTTPSLAQLEAVSDLDDPLAPRTAADIAWSEYNHNVAGLIVLGLGLLAALDRLAGIGWARHWPLAFLPLSVFLLFRSDPGSWPLSETGDLRRGPDRSRGAPAPRARAAARRAGNYSSGWCAPAASPPSPGLACSRCSSPREAGCSWRMRIPWCT